MPPYSLEPAGWSVVSGGVSIASMVAAALSSTIDVTFEVRG